MLRKQTDSEKEEGREGEGKGRIEGSVRDRWNTECVFMRKKKKKKKEPRRRYRGRMNRDMRGSLSATV